MHLSKASRGVCTRALAALGALAYIASLHWSYATVMAEWRYMGYTYDAPPLAFVVLAWCIAIVPSFWMPLRFRRPSQVAYWLLYIVVFVPACIVPLYTVRLDPNILTVFSLTLFAAFGLLGGIYWLPLLRVPRIRIPRKFFWAGIILLSVLFYALILSAYGLKPRFLSLAAIYELRATFKAAQSAGNGMLGYVVGWQSNAINPLLIAHGLISRNVGWVLLGVLGQGVIYSITGYKSALFSAALLLAVLLALHSRGKRMGLYFIWGSVALVLSSALLKLWWGSGAFFSIFVRRLIITPGLLTGYYFQYYLGAPKMLLSHSILRSFVNYPTAVPPAFQISAAYFADPSISANANLWADAYANFGFYGIFAFTFIIGLVMWLFDSFSNHRDLRMAALLFCMSAFYLTNTALLTSLLTHGAGLALLIAYLLPRTGACERIPRQNTAGGPEGAMLRRARVVHATTVHNAFDVRIFHKECKTLAEAGYDVVLIAPHGQDEVVDGVQIRAVPKSRGRLRRITCTAWRVFLAAMRQTGSVIHFHDPELLPAGLVMKVLGKRVIYDVHEDYVTSIRQKDYLPRAVRIPLAAIWSGLEVLAVKPFHIVLAEKYYARRFPSGISVLNYPIKKHPPCAPGSAISSIGMPRVLYTGTVAVDRGALICAQIVALWDAVEVFVVGRCSRELAERMRQVAGSGKERLHIEGEGFYVPHERMEELYSQGGWTAGLAVFPPSPHYAEKELTKVFEYMQASIPVVCSRLPVCQSIVERTGAGLSVDPSRAGDIVAAIQYLAAQPDEVARMGAHGRELVDACYNWDTEANKLLALYDELTTPIGRRARLDSVSDPEMGR
jgi:glycosyltransferase involved in cell wall biosynthesis